MPLKINFKNRKTEFTRMCIAEAVIELLEKKSLSQISVSAVVLKAGVSRMTYYNNYSSIEDALKDYMQIIVGRYMEACNNHPDIGRFRQYEHILFSLKFFDEYRKFFLTMNRGGLSYIVLDAVDRFVTDNVNFERKVTGYEINFYAGGLLNVFMRWEENKDRASAEEVARILCDFMSGA